MPYKLAQNELGLIDVISGASIPLARGNRHFEAALVELTDLALVIDNGDNTYTFSPDEVNLFDWDKPSVADMRSVACSAIDAAAGRARARYITIAPGQEATYLEKAKDAQAFIDAVYPEVSIANYPFVQAEANALGVSGQVAADGIITTRDSWLTLAANIEEERIAGKKDVNSRMVENTINTAKDNAIAALDLI